MALPKEPRQKMINLMYLVLTALLALNVSAEILNAFKTVDNSLHTANMTIDTKNQQLLSSFEELKNDPKTADRANKWAPLAFEAQSLSKQMIDYIEGLKLEIKKSAKGTPPAYEDFKEDDLEGPTNVMADPGTKGKELLQKLTAYKNSLLNISPDIKAAFQNNLPLDLATPPSSGEIKKSWSDVYFNMVPAIAGLTILSKFENDIKNSEAMIVDYCHQQVGNVKFVINTYKPLVGQSSNYLMPGQELTITAGIGAYNSEAQPKISIDGANVPLNANGVAEYKFNVGGPSPNNTKTVHIVYVDQTTGQQTSVDYPVTYAVGSPTGTSVSADDVKVLYVGLQNHLSISSNVGDEKIHASIDNGNLSKTAPGKYIVEPAKAGNANVHVVVDGKPQDYPFRVKTVPDPVAKVGNNKGGPMKANEFKAQFGVRADLENFVFEGVKFDVVSYTLVLNGAGFPTLQFRQVNGNKFDPVRDLIEKTRPGTTVVIDDIRAQGPGGTRKLTPIVFNLTP
ncbi:MAG TPA: gliding motility protein GldM [Chitinophagaceae bacterium]|jgi:gliding motility-associated protein GldM